MTDILKKPPRFQKPRRFETVHCSLLSITLRRRNDCMAGNGAGTADGTVICGGTGIAGVKVDQVFAIECAGAA